MEEYRMDRDEHRFGDCHRYRMWKYLGVIVATLFGSFLAFYFAVSCAMSNFMSPAYAMHKMHKMDRMVMRDFREMDKDISKMSSKMFHQKSALEFIKTPDAYKFVVDLTPFQGNADAVNVMVNGRLITISGEAETNTKNYETFTKMSQTYSLCKGANIEKMSKKTVDNKYIITIPIED